MTTLYTSLKSVNSKKLTGKAYYVDDVANGLSPKVRRAFNEWLVGKTLILIRGREVIYQHKLERFFDRLGEILASYTKEVDHI